MNAKRGAPSSEVAEITARDTRTISKLARLATAFIGRAEVAVDWLSPEANGDRKHARVFPQLKSPAF